jgi:iron complex transport system permease protein
LGWNGVALLAAVLVVALPVAVALGRGLDALTLGEDTASSLGLSLARLRLGLLALVAVVTASVVGQCGIIGFIGLVAPHLVRQRHELAHRWLLLASAATGGVLLQAADLLSRWLIQPAELPVGAVTACLGGTYLIVLLWRRSRHV